MSAVAAANEILKSAKRIGRPLTPMQVTKLAYIAHGFAIAGLDRDMFDDRIEAWKFGPVIPNIYHATKQYGRNSVPLDLISEDQPSCFDSDMQSIIDQVVEKYSHLSGAQLSDLTHQPDSPWHQVYQSGIMGIEIPDSVIAEHYRGILNG